MRSLVAALLLLALAACSGPTTITTVSSCDTPLFFQGDSIYWGSDAVIFTMPANGGSVTQLVDGGILFYVDRSSLYFVTLTSIDQDAGPPGYSSWALARLPLDGGAIGPALSGIDVPQGPPGFATQPFETWDLATDSTRVYWVDWNRDLQTAPLAGGTSETFVAGPVGGQLFIGGQFLFLVSGDGASDVPLDGGTREDLLPALPEEAVSATADSQGAYMATEGSGDSSTCDGEIVAALLEGGSAILATNQCWPTAIGVDDTTVYWSTRGAIGQAGPAIFAVPKTGGEPKQLASVQGFSLAPSGSYLYFCDDKGIERVSK
jgi:hypothetical protein